MGDGSNSDNAERLYNAFKAVADGEGRTSYSLARVARVAGLSIDQASAAMSLLTPKRIISHKFGWVVTDVRCQQSERPAMMGAK